LDCSRASVDWSSGAILAFQVPKLGIALIDRPPVLGSKVLPEFDSACPEK
jgi:hypothetical protein